MYIHQLRQAQNVVIYREGSGHMHVMTPEGAVFDSFNTDDLLDLTINYGYLFDDQWRLATPEEERAWLATPDDRMMEIRWKEPPPAEPPVRLVVDNTATP